MKNQSADKIAEYSAVAKKGKSRKPLSFAEKLIVLLSVTTAFVVTAVIVLSLYFVGILVSVIPVQKRGNTQENEDAMGEFVDYQFDTSKLPAGKYATITFLCNDKEYAVTAYLFSAYAPNTVSNFVSYVKKEFYNGTAVRSGAIGYDGDEATGRMVCGGFVRNADGTIMTKIPDEGADAIKGEFYANGYDTNRLSNTAGVIGMIHAMNNDDATTDFYILPYDDTSLNGKYAAFAKVTTQTDLTTIRFLAKSVAEDVPVSIKTITVTDKK